MIIAKIINKKRRKIIDNALFEDQLVIILIII